MNQRFTLLVALSGCLLFCGRLAADVNVLIIGSTKDSGERHNSSVSWNSLKPAYTPNSVPFSPTEIGVQLQNILSQDGRGAINVSVLERYASQALAGPLSGWNAYSYNLATWFHYPYPAGAETNRWANLRGEAGTVWDYVVLIGDPYTMEYTPGMYAYGVARIAEEVAKGSAQLVLLMPWPGQTSTSTVNHYKEVVYRTGRSGNIKVAPAALAWQACGSPVGGSHPTTDGAYIAAASIYSAIYNQSAAASGYVHNDSHANITQTTFANNNTASQYTGTFGFQNPYRILDDKRRNVHTSERGTSTEDGFKDKIGTAMTRAMVSHTSSPYNDKYNSNTPDDDGLGWPTGSPMPIAFNYGRDGFYSESSKSYVINPAYWQAGFGYYIQNNTFSQPVETANDLHIGLMQKQDNDLANRMINEAPTARNVPIRTLWAQIHKAYPTLNPLRDGSGPHLSYDLEEAVGTFIYTMYSGRCPLDPKPAVDDVTWTCRRIGYETAWMTGRCQSRAPGFKVTPSAIGTTTVTPTTPETMTVRFILPPTSDVTVNVSIPEATAAIVGPKKLIFTPANYSVPQTVTVKGLPGSSSFQVFNVNFSTTSSDPVYDGLSDSWSYTNIRSSTQTLNAVDNGSTVIVAPMLTPTALNLNVPGASASNTQLAGPNFGSIAWNGSNLVYTSNSGFAGTDGVAFAVNNGGTLTTGYFDIVSVVPEGQINVAATVGTAYEQGSTSGTWTISRVGATTSAVTVFFTLSGTATLNSDYTVFHTGSVTIPIGQSSATVTLTAIDDAIADRNETAILTISQNVAYPIGVASAATITIVDNDYVNSAPVVNAGSDQSVTLSSGGVATLNAIATDADNDPLNTTWSVVSGPAAVNFGNANSLATTATFTQAGIYVLRLTADDGVVQSSDEITITIQASTYTWSGPDGGTWDQTGTNWSPAGASWSGNTYGAVLGSGTPVLGASVRMTSFTGDASSSITSGVNNGVRISSGTSTFAGTIGQNVQVVWDGAAFLDFSGNNNDTANQWVFRNGGTFRISSANAWKTTSNSKVEASSTTFTFELAAADLSINTGNMLLNNSGTAGLRFAALNADRTVTWTGATPGGAATAINWASTGGIGETLAFGNANATHKLTWASGINLNGGSGATLTRTINVTNGTAAVGGEISGVISDSGTVKATLLKTGTGTLLLSNANTYAGATTVSNGTLVVGQTNALGTGTATVKTNATLAIASGVVYTRAVTFEAGSVLAGQGTFTTNNWTTPAGLTLKPGLPVGSPTGTLTVAVGGAGNALTLGANNVLRTVIQPDGVTCGKLTVTGALDISAATARLVVSGPMPASKIVLADGTSISGRFQSGNVDLSGLTGPGADKATIYYTSTQVLLGPPPSGMAILIH